MPSPRASCVFPPNTTYVAHGCFKRTTLGRGNYQHPPKQFLAFYVGDDGTTRVNHENPFSFYLLSRSLLWPAMRHLHIHTGGHVEWNPVLAHQNALAKLLQIRPVKGQRATHKRKEDDTQAPDVNLGPFIFPALEA